MTTLRQRVAAIGLDGAQVALVEGRVTVSLPPPGEGATKDVSTSTLRLLADGLPLTLNEVAYSTVASSP
jgi:hypothetical protein